MSVLFSKLSNQDPFLADIFISCSKNYIRDISSISNFSTMSKNEQPSKQPALHPYFVTGFSDGESYFYIGLNRSAKMKTGWSLILHFGISLNKRDHHLLELIKEFFKGVGSISLDGKDRIRFRVSSIKDLQVIVDYFDNFPLITQKWSDFQLFKSAFELVKCKKHLTLDGLGKYC